MEKENTERVSIVYLDEDIPSLLTILRLFVKQKLGKLTDDFEVLPRIKQSKSFGARTSEFISVFSTRSSIEEDFENDWSQFLQKMRESDDEEALDFRSSTRKTFILCRLKNYALQCHQKKGVSPRQVLEGMGSSSALYDTFIGIQSRYFGDQRRIFQETFKLLAFFIDNKKDPFKTLEVDCFEEYSDPINSSARLSSLCLSADRRDRSYQKALRKRGVFTVSFPKLKRQPDGHVRAGETEIERDDKGKEIFPVFEFPLGALKILEGENLSIVVVGPPHSGKTSLVASLLYRAEQFIDGVKQNPQFSDSRLKCGYVDLDEWTPDARRLLSQQPQLPRKQTPWNNSLASKVFHQYLASKKFGAQITFCDSPGGEFDPEEGCHKPNDILRTIIAPADAAIVLTSEWRQQNAWRKVLSELGIKPIVFLHSRPGVELDSQTGLPIDSTITTFSKGSLILSGRIVNLTGDIKEHDGFIERAVPILLLHILPSLVQEKNDKIRSQLSLLSREQFDRYKRTIQR